MVDFCNGQGCLKFYAHIFHLFLFSHGSNKSVVAKLITLQIWANILLQRQNITSCTSLKSHQILKVFKQNILDEQEI
jgi:hypothetical protein